jgi:hypothetical protein
MPNNRNDAMVTNHLQHLFDEDIRLTSITEFGLDWQELRSGQAQIPAQGARFDLAFEGTLSGTDINGSIKGIDYMEVRADGKMLLNIHAIIVTGDGETIALKEDGLLTPNGDGSGQLHLNMHFSTVSEKYNWLNTRQIWGVGQASMSEGTVTVRGFSN